MAALYQPRRRGGYTLVMPTVVIAGAGLSGLATAYRLLHLRPDLTLHVCEAAPRPGGNIGTVERAGFRVELGPNGFLDSKPAMRELCRDLGIAGELIPASEGSRKNRYVYHRGRVARLPASPLGLLTTPLLSLRGKLDLLGEPFRRRGPGHDESVAAFARRRLGREAAGVFLEALVTGVHAADWEQLSVAAAFPRLAHFEAAHGSLLRGVLAAGRVKKRQRRASGERYEPTRMWSFPTGLQRLVDALRDRLGPHVRPHSPVTRVSRTLTGWMVLAGGDTLLADAVVLTQPAPFQAECVADLDPALSADMAAIAYSPVAVVALGYRAADCRGDLDGFGYIAPPSAGRPVLGVQWCSSIFPGRAPPGHVLWRALCGGATRPDVYALDDAPLTATVHAEMRHAMGVRGDPVFAQVVRWPRAIPHYTVGHPARVERIDRAVALHPGLFVTGNAFRGVAMNDVAEQAGLVAGRAAGFLAGA